MVRITLALLALSSAFTATSVVAEQPKASAIPAQRALTDFARLPAVQSPVLAPGGGAYAARLAIDGKQYLAIVPLDGSKPRLVRAGDAQLNWWNWVNDQWLIVGMGDMVMIGGTDMYATRALAVSADGKRHLVLAQKDAAQNADDVIWTANDGTARVLLAYQTSAYADEDGFWPMVREFDLDTGKSRIIQRPMTNVVGWYADGAGTVRLGLGYGDEGRTTRVLYRSGPGQGLRVIDRARTHRESVIVPSLFLPEGQKALVIADDDGGFSNLYEFDLATMQRGKSLFATKGYDIGSIRPDETGSKVLGVHTNEERPGVRWLDPDVAAIEAKAAAQVKGARARLVSFTRDRARAIVLVDGPDAPGVYMLYDVVAGDLEPIAYVNEAFRMNRLHPVRTIRYKARDGLEIAAVLTLPKSKGKARNLPLIVMPHGGPFARDTEEWDWWTQFLADRGYAVIQPNYRGSSGYGTSFTQMGEGQWGLAMQDDLNDAVTALAEQGIADPKRVCMVGASYGGYAAMRAAQRDGNLYRCAVSYAGVSDLPAMKRYDGRFLLSGARTEWLKRQAPDLAAVSPINAVDGFSTPLLLVHGAKDRVVPLRQSKSIAGKLKSAGKDVTYMEQPEADHHFSRAEDRVEFLRALETFLAKHNPA